MLCLYEKGKRGAILRVLSDSLQAAPTPFEVSFTYQGEVMLAPPALANDTAFGLTAGLFSKDESEIEQFFDRIEAGVTYANRRSGATTGAWPGVNPFCGWKSSGSTGKGVCGPYYVSQFLREQSRTLME